MGLRLIGSDQLLYLQSELLDLTIKGNTKLAIMSNNNDDTDKPSIIRVRSKAGFKVFLSGLEPIKNPMANKFKVLTIQTKPLFFEQQNYEIILETRPGHTIEFRHINQNLRKKVSPVGSNKKLLTGVLRFDNEIGYSDLQVFIDGVEYLTLTIEVFPSKITYKDDYQAIIEDITKEVYNLTFDVLRKTYRSYDIPSEKQTSPVEFFAIIQSVFEDFLRATDRILKNPHHLLQKEYEVLKPNQIKQTDVRSVRWLETHPDHFKREGASISVDKALAVKKYVTYDTKENRLSKYMLEETAKRLISFSRQYELLDRETDSLVVQTIERMVAEISRRTNTGFMREVAPIPENTGMSLVFKMAPGYRDLFKYYLMLQHGLSLTGELYNLSLKDLAILYEYWCFIKLNSLMRDKYELVSQDIIRIERNGLYFTLAKGKKSKVKYITPKGENITLSYNPAKINLPTGPQKPDNILKLEKIGSFTTYEYIFDAKYRIDRADKGTYYYQTISPTPGPKIDDINTMHRYRDAIVYKRGAELFERIMFGAYVLFPYNNEDEYKNHMFYQSIPKVNVGGLPFLPSATNLVSEMVTSLIDESIEDAMKRKIQ